MTEAEKARFRRQCESLAEIENDDMGTPEIRRAMIESVNRVLGWSLSLEDDHDDEDPPELGIHRRIQSLGMARSRR